MNGTIKLPFHVEKVDNFAKIINDEILQINVLIRQLHAHWKQIAQLKADKPMLHMQVLNLTRLRDDVESDRNACSLTLAKLEEMNAETSVSEIKKKYRIFKLKQEWKNRKKELQDRLDKVQEGLEEKSFLLMQASTEKIYTHEENYKSHLRQLYQAVREYKTHADTFRAMTGVVLPRIDPTEFLETKEEQMPTVKEVKEFPTIEVETPHCVVVCE